MFDRLFVAVSVSVRLTDDANTSKLAVEFTGVGSAWFHRTQPTIDLLIRNALAYLASAAPPCVSTPHDAGTLQARALLSRLLSSLQPPYRRLGAGRYWRYRIYYFRHVALWSRVFLCWLVRSFDRSFDCDWDISRSALELVSFKRYTQY